MISSWIFETVTEYELLFYIDMGIFHFIMQAVKLRSRSQKPVCTLNGYRRDCIGAFRLIVVSLEQKFLVADIYTMLPC